MPILLKIDNREKDLIQLLEEHHIEIIKENLDIGDIQIIEHEIDTDQRHLLVLIERKSYLDLSNSIKDGRYKEQKNRILNSIPENVRKMYILEGNVKEFKLKRSVLDGTILNTLLRDNLHIHYTKSIQHTMDFILLSLKNIDKFKENIKTNCNTNTTSTSLIHVVKKKNMNSETCFLNMICGIPGISNKTGGIVVEKYGSIGNMLNYFNDTLDKDKHKIIAELENIKVGINLRKLGNKHASKIYEFIYEDTLDNTHKLN